MKSLMLILVALGAYQAVLTPLQQQQGSRKLPDRSKTVGAFFMNPEARFHERRLNEDLYDDSILFGTPKAMTKSIEEQSRVDEMSGTVINFNRSYDELRRRLETYRRYSAGDIPNDIRVSALNAYIENAIVMQNLGVLDEEEEEQEDEFKDYYAESLSLPAKARKAKIVRGLGNKAGAALTGVQRSASRANRRAVQRTILSNRQRHLRGTGLRKLPDAPAKVSITAQAPKAAGEFEALDRANNLEFGSENTMQGESDGPFGSPYNAERRLWNYDLVQKRRRHSHRRLLRRHRMSPAQVLRQGDAMMELARAGNLLDIDFNAVYDLTGEEIPHDLSWHGKAKAPRRDSGFKI